MITYVAVLIVYLYGMGSPPHTYVRVADSEAACQEVVATAKAEVLKEDKVRDARGGCVAIQVPAPRDKS